MDTLDQQIQTLIDDAPAGATGTGNGGDRPGHQSDC
jgi:hypothetical protein